MRRFERAERRIKPGEDGQIALRTDVKHWLAGALSDEVAGYVARSDDRVRGRMRHVQVIEQARHLRARARRIRDQHHGAAAIAKARQRLARRRKRRNAVVNHPPDVGEDRVVVRRKRGEMIGEDRRCH